MDVLSEVLKGVKLDGAVFFNGEFAAPWCSRGPDSGTMASYLSTQAKHIIIFHLVLEGRGYARLEQEDRTVPLMAGDIMILPHGDAHLMGNGPPVTPVDTSQQLRQILAEGRVLSQLGGGGQIDRGRCQWGQTRFSSFERSQCVRTMKIESDPNFQGL